MSKNNNAWGCSIVAGIMVLFVLAAVFGPCVPSSGNGYHEGTLRQHVYTAEVDQRKAARLLAAGRKAEGEEYLSRAEEKLYRGQQEKADQTFLKVQGTEVGQVKAEHAEAVNPIRKRRGQERLRQKAESTRLALKALRAKAEQRRAQARAQEFRNDAWDELIRIAQERIGRQAPGAEGYAEDPLRVAPALLRQALSLKRGVRYVADMDRHAPGACEAVSKEAEDLAGTP